MRMFQGLLTAVIRAMECDRYRTLKLRTDFQRQAAGFIADA